MHKFNFKILCKMDIKDYIHEYRELQKQKKKVRVADFCRERSLDYYEMVNALKQEKFEAEYGQEEPATVGDLVITGLPAGSSPSDSSAMPTYIKEVMLSFPSGLRLTVREITPDDIISIVQRLMPVRKYA